MNVVGAGIIAFPLVLVSTEVSSLVSKVDPHLGSTVFIGGLVFSVAAGMIGSEMLESSKGDSAEDREVRAQREKQHREILQSIRDRADQLYLPDELPLDLVKDKAYWDRLAQEQLRDQALVDNGLYTGPVLTVAERDILDTGIAIKTAYRKMWPRPEGHPPGTSWGPGHSKERWDIVQEGYRLWETKGRFFKPVAARESPDKTPSLVDKTDLML